MAKSNAIIVKRVKKGGHGHHGGAWKVAYADFVTAMMAFFLLLWLLNATTDAQKRGIADYFAPSLATKSTTSGAGGILGGKTITAPGEQVSTSSPVSVQSDISKPSDYDDDQDQDQSSNSSASQNNADAGGNNAPQTSANPNDKVSRAAIDWRRMAAAIEQGNGSGGTTDTSKLSDAQFQALKAQREEKQFKQAESQLRQAIQDVPDLKPLANNLVVDRTDEGLRIQLVDQDKTAMFATGSTELSSQAQRIMALIRQAVAKLPNKIAITGHTDSTQYAGNKNYSNWELSTDRANAARRALIAAGLSPDRIATVVGKADTENLIANDPSDPRNRRISIVVLRSGLDGSQPPGARSAPAAAAPASTGQGVSVPISPAAQN